MKRPYLFLVCLFLFEACSGGGGGSSSQAISGVVVSPHPLAVQKGNNTLQFSAKDLSGQPIPQSSLTWSVDGTSINGMVNSNGLYSAPANIPPQNPVTLRATSVADSTKNDAVSFYILTGPTIVFPSQSTDTLFNQQGSPASFHIAVFNQNSYVTWATTLAMGGTGVWYSKGDSNGHFSVPHNILLDLMNYNYTITNTTVKNPVIAIDNTVDSSGDLGVYIAWDDRSNGPYQINLVKGPNSSSTGCVNPPPCFVPFALTGTGNTTSLQVDSSPQNLDQTNPSLAISLLGKLEFAWTEVYSSSSGNSNLITYEELNGDGSVAKLPSQVFPSQTQTSQITPQIAVDHSGNVSVSWMDYGGTQYPPPNIFYSRMVLGQPFSPAIPVEADTLATSDTFSMSLDYYGQPHFAWSKSSSGTPTGIYYSTAADFANFTSPVKLTSGGYNPTIKVDLLNYLYFTWDDGASIYFQKVKAPLGQGSLANPQLTRSGVNPAMNIDVGGRAYLLYSTTGSTTLSTYFIRGE